jgi:Prealbumin-like fold domain
MARARRLVGACAALMVAALIGGFPGSAWPQTPARTCAGPLALVNGSFEEPASVSAFAIKLQDQVPGWSTTEPDGRIELWQSGYQGVPAASGEQFAELAANQPGELYEDVATVPGTQLGYAVSHRGRDGLDTMQIQIGPPGVAPNFTRDVMTGNTGWRQVLGTYRVPAGQTVTRFGFAALSSASPMSSEGNFLDGVTFGSARCSVALSKLLRPVADPGRFDLLLGDEVIVAGAGDGSRSLLPTPVALSAVRVSERAVAGARLDEYASAVSCRDAASGELLAQAAGPELLLSFDRRRHAACTVANVRAPAVVAQKVLYPPDASGRFDLLINGRVQAAAAGDHAVAGPVAVDAGDRVVVSERAAAGTRASDYVSAVQCRSRAGRGPVVAQAPGRSVSYTAAAAQVIVCVLINLRQSARPCPDAAARPAPCPRRRRHR